MVLQELPLDSGSNRKAEIHLLKILLRDIQGLGAVDGAFPETVIDCVDGVLEVFAFCKTDKRDGRLHKDRKDGIVVVQFFITISKGICCEYKCRQDTENCESGLGLHPLPSLSISFLLSGDASFRLLVSVAFRKLLQHWRF